MILGRITRGGQRDPAPKWTVIQCKTEGFDAVSIARCEKNLSEAQAILLIEEKHDREGDHDEAEKRNKNKSSWKKDFIEIFDRSLYLLPSIASLSAYKERSRQFCI